MAEKEKFLKALDEFFFNVVKVNTLAGNDTSDKGLIPLYHKLIHEESGEMIKAIKEKDTIEFFDGLIDTMVVAGYATMLHNNNLDNWDLSEEDKDNVGRIGDTLKVKELDSDSVDFIINSAIAEAYRLNKRDKFDVVGMMDEISRSNLTKFPKTSECDPHQEVEKIVEQGRYSGITFNRVEYKGEYYYNFMALRDEEAGVDFEKPKFVKPSVYSKPELSKFIGD